MYELRDYQKEIIEKIEENFLTKNKIMVQLATGGGKSCCFAYLCNKWVSLGKKVLILAHRKELITQARDHVARYGVKAGIIMNGFPLDLSCKVQVASTQTIVRREKLVFDPDYVILDECFVSGTKIGGKPIEEIKIGEKVLSYCERTGEVVEKTVTRLFKNPAPEKLLKLSFRNKGFLVCTENHPFFVNGEWIVAKDLKEGDIMASSVIEERLPLIPVRLESIEIYEQRDREKFREVCPDGFVYNLEVEDTHTYFAENILVHNCHHFGERNSTGKVISRFKNAKVLGFTATPCRLDGKGFDGFFEELICGIDISELIAQGHLCRYELYTAPLDKDALKKVRTTAGDYNEKDLAEVMERTIVLNSLVDNWERLAKGKKTVVFAVNVEHSRKIVDLFLGRGVAAEHLDGATPMKERADILQRFREGKTLILSNCNIISEGFDLPSIECVQFARPTKSLTLYLQQAGRALRPEAGKEKALFLDHANNTQTHGLVDEFRVWKLKGVFRCPKDLTELFEILDQLQAQLDGWANEGINHLLISALPSFWTRSNVTPKSFREFIEYLNINYIDYENEKKILGSLSAKFKNEILDRYKTILEKMIDDELPEEIISRLTEREPEILATKERLKEYISLYVPPKGEGSQVEAKEVEHELKQMTEEEMNIKKFESRTKHAEESGHKKYAPFYWFINNVNKTPTEKEWKAISNYYKYDVKKWYYKKVNPEADPSRFKEETTQEMFERFCMGRF